MILVKQLQRMLLNKRYVQRFFIIITRFLKLYQVSFLMLAELTVWKRVEVLFRNNPSRWKKKSTNFITTYVDNFCCPPIIVFFRVNFFNSVSTETPRNFEHGECSRLMSSITSRGKRSLIYFVLQTFRLKVITSNGLFMVNVNAML